MIITVFVVRDADQNKYLAGHGDWVDKPLFASGYTTYEDAMKAIQQRTEYMLPYGRRVMSIEKLFVVRGEPKC